MGNFAGVFFRTHKIKAQKFGENFAAFFVRKFVPPKKIFRANFVLQTCHPQFYLCFTSILRTSFLPDFDPYSASNLELQSGNHDLQTLGSGSERDKRKGHCQTGLSKRGIARISQPI